MSNAKGAGPLEEADTERRVVEYLNKHPDFFARHLNLLEHLCIPHPCAPAVSLIERQLSLLRDQNTRLRRRLLDLIEVARRNDHIAERMQRLALELIETTTLDDLLGTIKSLMRDEFGADFTALRLVARPLDERQAALEEFADAAQLASFAAVLRGDRPRCGGLSANQSQALFDAAAPQVASAALVPLRGSGWSGLLAVGSHDEKRFHRGMGTLFLSRMGAMISQALQPHLLDPVSGPING